MFPGNPLSDPCWTLPLNPGGGSHGPSAGFYSSELSTLGSTKRVPRDHFYEISNIVTQLVTFVCN